MGYYAAGDPGLFDFFESAANDMFSAGAESMGAGTFTANPGALTLSRVLQTAGKYAKYIPVVGTVAGAGLEFLGGGAAPQLSQSVGALSGWTAPSQQLPYDDMQTYFEPTPLVPYEDFQAALPTSSYSEQPIWEYLNPINAAPIGESLDSPYGD